MAREHTPTAFEIDQGCEHVLKERAEAGLDHELWTRAEVHELASLMFHVGANWVIRRKMGTEGPKPKPPKEGSKP